MSDSNSLKTVVHITNIGAGKVLKTETFEPNEIIGSQWLLKDFKYTKFKIANVNFVPEYLDNGSVVNLLEIELDVQDG